LYGRAHRLRSAKKQPRGFAADHREIARLGFKFGEIYKGPGRFYVISIYLSAVTYLDLRLTTSRSLLYLLYS
jgi:hypothetical protein